METVPRARRRVGVLRVLAVGHLLVSAAAIVVVIAWFRAGMRPEAELEGLLVFLALVAAFPTTAFTLMSLNTARRAFRTFPTVSAWSAVLGLVETALGASFIVVVSAGVSYPSELPGRFAALLTALWAAPAWPLDLPAAVFLLLGLTTIWVAISGRGSTD